MMLRRIVRSLPVVVLVACDPTASRGPVAAVELSHSTMTLGPAERATITAVVRAANGDILDRRVSWSSDDPAVATVAADGQVLAIGFGTTTIVASVEGQRAETGVTVTATQPAHLAGWWRMQSFDGKTLPASYWYEADSPIDDDGNTADVDIRLDSARLQMGTDGRYPFRQYCFTELHDAVARFQYCWGDHGVFSVPQPGVLSMWSEYIENLSAAGSVTTSGQLSLTEPLWLSETPRATIWARQD
jgi:hypothetical protein